MSLTTNNNNNNNSGDDSGVAENLDFDKQLLEMKSLMDEKDWQAYKLEYIRDWKRKKMHYNKIKLIGSTATMPLAAHNHNNINMMNSSRGVGTNNNNNNNQQSLQNLSNSIGVARRTGGCNCGGGNRAAASKVVKQTTTAASSAVVTTTTETVTTTTKALEISEEEAELRNTLLNLTTAKK